MANTRHGIKVRHLTSVHRADDPRIMFKECMTLANAGYDVGVVAPAGENAAIPEQVNHVPVPRSPGRLRRMLRTTRHVYRAAIREDARIYHLHDPELIPAGLLLRLRGRAVIYDAHEDLGHQVLHKAWVPRLLRPLMGRGAGLVERTLAGRLSAVVAATPAIARRFPRGRTTLVRNLARIEEFSSAAAVPYAERPPVVAYVGSVTEARGAREMVDAIGLVGSSTPTLRIAGDFSPRALLDDVGRRPGWGRVEVLGWQDRAGVARLLAGARIGLVCLHPTPSYIESYPVKLFEYMAAGIPVVASDFPLWREIVADAGCGVLVDPLDPSAIARAIEQLLADASEAEAMGRRGREAVTRTWSWEVEGARLVALYDRLSGITRPVQVPGDQASPAIDPQSSPTRSRAR